MNNEHRKYIEEDEIDLRELWKIIVEQKKLIIVFTLLVTIASIIYVLMKNPTPIYSGNMMIEIGQVKNKNTDLVAIDDANDLFQILNKNGLATGTLPKNSRSVVVLTVSNKDKNEIKNILNTTKDFILNRHKEKVKLYNTYIMTKQIGEISIDNKPINTPKKKLIVTLSFVTGLILSIFIVFFLDFIKKNKEEEL